MFVLIHLFQTRTLDYVVWFVSLIGKCFETLMNSLKPLPRDSPPLLPNKMAHVTGHKSSAT